MTDRRNELRTKLSYVRKRPPLGGGIFLENPNYELGVVSILRKNRENRWA